MSGFPCASCGATNEADARFCESCGSPLQRSCSGCGGTASATARFCRSCGASLDDQRQQPVSSPTRKTVTVLFADLAGSTAFEEVVDPETARDVIGQYHELLRATAERHRAGVTKYIGDGFMAVWGVPEIGADDAGQAVDAAIELQERFVGLASHLVQIYGVELALRVAVNTGEVVVGADDADLVGDALNVGARLESECPHGHVVVGEETWRSTRGRHRYDPLGSVQVKGRTAAVPVYQWVARRTETADSIPFVGRSTELHRLRSVFDDALSARGARLVTIVGDPGVGKTRLAAEFIGTLGDDVQVVRAHCAVEGSPAMTPLVDVLRARDLATDIAENVPERDRILRDLTGMTAGVAASVEETFWALRRFVEVLSTDSPVVLVIDDIQWADALLLDFIEHLVEWVRDNPVLLVGLARPELRESRPDLVTVGGWVAEALRLRGLEADATAELAARVLGSHQLPDELLSRLPSSTGGNPLFVRELVGMLVHDGVLIAKPGGWSLTVDVDAISIPPTIQALLASRLERLNAANRRVLEVASVIGTDFSPSAVAALGGVGGAEIMSALNRLRRLDLAQPSGTYAGDEPVWRFHHVLIRDVAYRRLLKSERAELHERLANWVHAGGASAAFEPDEVIARNLEAAHGYRCDLGMRDGHTGELALRSARSYLTSARRALDRDELGSAGTKAARGAALATADAALHAELLLVGCEAFLSAGDVAAGGSLVDRLESVAGQDLAPWATCYRCQLVAYTDPSRLLEVDTRLQDVIDEFSRRKDATGLAKAHRVRANARARLGRVGDCEADLFEALIAARQGGDHRQITAALGAAPNAALWGPSPAPKAGGRCLDVVRMQRMTTAAPSLEATSLRCLAVLELLRGRPDKARSMLADARQVVADLGLRHGLMETELFAGIIELMVGDAVAAEPHFRTALEGLDSMGVGADAGQAAALLARSVLAQGRLDEADKYAAESERIAGHNLKTAIAWRSVRAEILSAQGQHDRGVTMARDAVAVAAGTDLVLDHADACLALSRVLVSAGDERGAADARHDAEALYAAKDVVFMVVRPADPSPIAGQPDVGAGQKESRLAVVNRASAHGDSLIAAMQRHDVEGTVALWSDSFIFDDRRRLSGYRVDGTAQLRSAVIRICQQYSRFEARNLAVRGNNVYLGWTCWSDEAGNESRYLGVHQLGPDGLVVYHSRFDEDDFWSAYRDMERRYYADEGARFAGAGLAAAEWVVGISVGDINAVRAVSHPEFNWHATPSALKENERSVDDMFRWMRAREDQVVSQRHWVENLHWLSPTCSVGLGQIEATGPDDEKYRWNFVFVAEYQDGALKSVREFDVTDEDDAFAYAEQLVTSRSSRLALTTRTTEAGDRITAALQSGDLDAVVALYSDEVIFEDHRRISGDPMIGPEAMRAASQQIQSQFNHFAMRTLAVRGETLRLAEACWSDESGNRSINLLVGEIDGAGKVIYEGTFDEDDFDGAYRELERRYFAGEGAPYAAVGAPLTEMVFAENRGDLNRTFEFFTPGMRIESRSRSVFPRRTPAELRHSVEELGVMVESYRVWASSTCWLSSDVLALRHEREATGRDGEKFAWTRLYVGQVTDGRYTSLCEFDADDEEAAFGYAEKLVNGREGRLALDNRSLRVGKLVVATIEDGDVGAAVTHYCEDIVYEDHRRMSGDPIVGSVGARSAFERLRAQYSRFALQAIAVRGDNLSLVRSVWSDDDGNQSINFTVGEIDDNGQVIYQGSFDEDDFESAYAELERRYYSGEGADYAQHGLPLANLVWSVNRGDMDAFVKEFARAGLRFENRSHSLFPSRTPKELRREIEELSNLVSATRMWFSAIHWLSPNVTVGRFERDAVGPDGDEYTWTRIYAGQFEHGRLNASCEFDLSDEEAAFSYAEQLVASQVSRLAAANRDTQVVQQFLIALQSRQFDELEALYADEFEYADYRRLSGDQIVGRAAMRAAFERLSVQYSTFALQVLAVRGDKLSLLQTVWSDDHGNRSVNFVVGEIDDDDRVIYQANFDEDDFGSAYRELERRYYAGEGAAFATAGVMLTEFALCADKPELDRVLRDLAVPDLRVESRSRSIYPVRTLGEFRSSGAEFTAAPVSLRTWFSALHWISPNCVVGRHERQAVEPDGGVHEWTRIYVGTFREGLLASLCDFDAEAEAQALDYAEGLCRTTSDRLTVTNRAAEAALDLVRVTQAGNLDELAKLYSDDFVYDDRRRLNGDPIVGRVAVRAAFERLRAQYSHFALRVLAVRGDTLHLGRTTWADENRNQSSYLAVGEFDDDGRALYHAVFDEDDFESAYRELENRFYAGEGASARPSGLVTADYVAALNRGDFDTIFTDLSWPDLHIENRSRSGFPDRSAADLRASLVELQTMLASVHAWFANICWLSPDLFVGRMDREGRGHDGERFEWARILVGSYRDGRLARLCDFDVEDQVDAFAYAHKLLAE
ncbi:AAA family ATPase [Mycolicibacterium sp. P1-5]|uniref:AAA family ATPase n=1 Tax=Mycolicibacterium sp. P1-5 TaxID=2024617 RepID=UPI0011F053A2|nr:AAA family ATPase [Mycolicibacterium sp. P1-5]KAA0112190.1 adenylate cyclase [Mycolicibacterium sp. P1-5]